MEQQTGVSCAESSRATNEFTRREDRNVHDLESSIEHSPAALSPLSNLPSELREIVYSYIFHGYTSDHQCEHFYTRFNNLGCRCGQGLSRTNYFFYNEIRARYYQGARFVFTNPEKCQRFLDIGRITKNIGHLSISYKNNYAESSLLRPIFNHLLFSTCLESLHLCAIRDGSPRLFDGLGNMPIFGSIAHPALDAIRYDLSMRPVRHPIGGLRFVRSFVFVGEPDHEVEEAGLQLRFKMESLAKKEDKRLHVKSIWKNQLGEWTCENRIVDKFHEGDVDAIFFLDLPRSPTNETG